MQHTTSVRSHTTCELRSCLTNLEIHCSSLNCGYFFCNFLLMIIAVLNDINMLGADVQVYRTSKSYIEPLIF